MHPLFFHPSPSSKVRQWDQQPPVPQPTKQPHATHLLLSAPVLDCLLGHCGRHYDDKREQDGYGAVRRERAEGDTRDDEEEAVGDAAELLEERLGEEAGGRVLGCRYRVPRVEGPGAIGTRTRG